MARKRGKIALYEVMSKAQARAEHKRTVEPLQPKKEPEPVIAVPVEEEIDVPEPQVAVNWRKKPRILQYNLGRIEFSIPYQLAITAGLGLFLLLLLAFRFGQSSIDNNSQSESKQVAGRQTNEGTDLTTPLSSSGRTRTPEPDNGSNENLSPVTDSSENEQGLGDPDGTNVIVIAQYDVPKDLWPVQTYFNDNGIPTQVYKVGDKYMLWTVDKFVGDPGKANPGTKGYKVINRIRELGRNYKAPQGYESFAPNYFGDAYGKIVAN